MVSRPVPRFEIEEPASADVEFLEDRLYQFNADTTGIGDGRGLGVFLRDESNVIVAGAAGHTWGETCELRQVWVAEPLRGHGVGRRLIAEAEAEAVRRGCRQLVLATHSFQAPEFYRKLGFSVVSELPDYPRGYSHLVLRKTLSSRGGPMKQSAKARFAIKSWDEKPYSEGPDLPRLTRASVNKTFTGDIEGNGAVEYLMAYRSDGSAAFVGLERITGRIAGKSGSFVLQRTGVFEGGLAQESYSVVPGSGTGELHGLRGEGTSAVGHGSEHPFVLEYEFLG